METVFIHSIHKETKVTLVIKVTVPTHTLVEIIDSLTDTGYIQIKPIDSQTFNNFIKHHQALRCKAYMITPNTLELFYTFIGK